MTRAEARLIAEIVEHVDRFRRAVLLNALSEAQADYWNRRAETFEWAKPRPGDFTGEAMLPEMRDQWRRCHETAKACRARAEVSLIQRSDDRRAELHEPVPGLPDTYTGSDAELVDLALAELREAGG